MGKKGSWIAAIKRAFTPNSKERPGNEFEQRKKKEKKKEVGKVRHGESNSFIPLFREPSSVEKIFLDYEKGQQTPPFVTPTNASPTVVSRPKGFPFRPEPTLRNHHASATKIQAAYRGYAARRRFKALKGLVRLQGVVRGKNVKRQTMNAMKQMQLLARVQSQIQSRRTQMLHTHPRHHGPNHKDIHTQASESCNQEDWDDSLLTREEIEARSQRKAEALVKRERAMAYAYSHQLWKASPNSGQAVTTHIRAAGFPWWWNWLERQLPPSNVPSSEPQTLKNFLLAPQTPQQNPTPSINNKQHLHNMDQTTLTPKSTKSTILPATAAKPSQSSPAAFRTPPANSRSYSRPRSIIDGADSSPFGVGLKDDESLTSCPPFSVPHYMAPTVSAKAKLIGCTTPTSMSTQSKTRISLPFKWNKPNLFSNSNKISSTNNNPQRALDNNQSLQSIANLSVDSTVSLPAGVGRKPFNRFV